MMSDVYARTHGAVRPQMLVSLKRENTCTAMILAFFATPENACPAWSPVPAAMPATWVPCQQSVVCHGTAAPEPICRDPPPGHTLTLPDAVVEKHASSTILPAR